MRATKGGGSTTTHRIDLQLSCLPSGARKHRIQSFTHKYLTMSAATKMILRQFESIFDSLPTLESRVQTLEAEVIHLRGLVDSGGGYDFAAQLTGYSKQTLYNKVSQKLIPHRIRLGKPWFDREELEKWMDDPKYNDEYWERIIISKIKQSA